jgi:hypothetical protein
MIDSHSFVTGGTASDEQSEDVMPYRSKRQQRFMHAKHPGIAKRWDKKTRSFKSLPETAPKRKRGSRRRS